MVLDFYKKRSFWIRVAVIALLIALGVWMFFIGKQHTILLDNNRSGDYRPLDEVAVSIDGSEPLDIWSRMRDQMIVTGQGHTLTVTYVDDNWQEQTITRELDIPVGEVYMLLSLPYLINNPDSPQEEWLTHFESQAVAVTSDEGSDIVTDETAAFSSF